MKTKQRILRLAPLAAALATISIGVAGSAHADSYSWAYDNISDFQVTPGNAGITFSVPAVTTSDSASLAPGGGAAANNNTCVSGGPCSIPISVVGTGPGAGEVANSFTPAGASAISPTAVWTPSSIGASGDFAWGDAQIITQQSTDPCTGAACGQFTNAAESNINAGGTQSSAGAGINSSTTEVTASIPISINCATSASSCEISLSFDADPGLFAFLSAGSKLGSSAQASLSASFVLVANYASGATQTVVDAAPNGAGAGAIAGTGSGQNVLGGSFTADPNTLNTNVGLSGSAPINETQTYDPTEPGTDPDNGTSIGVGGFYALNTNALANCGTTPTWAGALGTLAATNCYTLNLNMTENVSDSSVIPEPGSLALLGLGLAGMGFLARRKRS
jgi:hypothetical protein